MYNKINNGNKTNLGIQLLRLLLSFWIIFIHCYYAKGNRKLYFLFEKTFHVPTFIFISFYFYYLKLQSRDLNKIYQRFQRLFIPYLIWPLIIYFVNNLCLTFFHFCQFGRYLQIKDYIIQIIIGRKYYGIFWYMNVLLFLSFFFTIIFFTIPNHFIFIIQLIGLLFYGLHFSSLYSILNKKNLVESSIILVVEMIPISVMGFTFGESNILQNSKNNRFRYIIIHAISLYYLFKLDIFNLHDGFFYPAIEMNTLAAINSFFIFSLLPFEKIQNQKIISILKCMFNYTGGIYYIHVFFRFYFSKIIINIKNKTFLGCLVIYFICYITCFFCGKIFKKSHLKFLFL